MTGTWIPLPDGRGLAAKNGVLDKLRPIFDFVPGDRSPPPAPKHATAATAKPRMPRAPAQPRRQHCKKGKSAVSTSTKSNNDTVYGQVNDYDQLDVAKDGGTPDNDTIVSDSAFDDFDHSQYSTSRKRRRIEEPMSKADREHQLWADELLDYFMLQDSPLDSLPTAPTPPVNADLNRPIDDKGHTALHWAAAMGDLEVVKDLIRGGARIDVQSTSGETPLMRAVVFTNNHDRQNMERLAGLLIRTVNMQEWFGSTVFHHIANTTERKSKYQCARYYIDCILNKMSEVLSTDAIERVLNERDHNGDTAITIAARNGARKCVRSLIGRNAAVDIPNNLGETADQLIVQLNHRRQERHSHRQLSSSPFQGDGGHGSLGIAGPIRPQVNGVKGGDALDPLLAHSSLRGTMTSLDGTSEVYRSEAALALTSSLMPVLLGKAQTLASTIDAEIAEKDAELAEAERVAAMRRSEIEALKRQAEELRVRELEQTGGGEDGDEQLLKELEELMGECEDLTEREQNQELKKLVDREQTHEESSPDEFAMEDEEETFDRKLILVRELHDLTQQRKDLVKTIVQNLSVAQPSDKQGNYKRLVTGALGVREEDVEGMLPEIVAELEDWRGLESIGA